RQLTRRELLGPAIVQNREVRLGMIETVVRGMLREFLKQPFRAFRPDVVVAGRKIQRILLERNQDLLYLPPFCFGGGIVQPLNCVSNTDDECRVVGCSSLPDLLVNSRLGFASP